MSWELSGLKLTCSYAELVSSLDSISNKYKTLNQVQGDKLEFPNYFVVVPKEETELINVLGAFRFKVNV